MKSYRLLSVTCLFFCLAHLTVAEAASWSYDINTQSFFLNNGPGQLRRWTYQGIGKVGSYKGLVIQATRQFVFVSNNIQTEALDIQQLSTADRNYLSTQGFVRSWNQLLMQDFPAWSNGAKESWLNGDDATYNSIVSFMNAWVSNQSAQLRAFSNDQTNKQRAIVAAALLSGTYVFKPSAVQIAQRDAQRSSNQLQATEALALQAKIAAEQARKAAEEAKRTAEDTEWRLRQMRQY